MATALPDPAAARTQHSANQTADKLLEIVEHFERYLNAVYLLVLGSLGIRHFVPKDTDFVRRMCELLGELRRSRLEPSPPG